LRSNCTICDTDGTITSQVSANPDAGFSIVSYTGTDVNNTIGHGLGISPDVIIFKDRTVGRNWRVYHSAIGAGQNLKLNTTDAASSDAALFQSTTPTENVFYVGASGDVNANAENFIAYCFHSVDGYQKAGSYTGTGAVNNQVNVGFQPRFVMQKRSDIAGGSWNIIDNLRGDDNYLSANYANAEGSMTASSFHLTSTGFTLDNSFSEWNASGGNYIYLAIA